MPVNHCLACRRYRHVEECAMAQPDGSGALIPGDLAADRRWLAAAIDLSRQAPASAAAFSVGALLVGASGEVIATGYSREVDPADHAEEVALRRAAGAELGVATLYSSLEPCLRRGRRAPFLPSRPIPTGC